MSVGGNIQALLQVKKENGKNSIGGRVSAWVDCMSIFGWLDLSTGDSKHTIFSAKIQESTHIFLCDYTVLTNLSMDEQESVDITSENARMVINGKAYEILLIDDPMEMHEHLEIYLRFIGGQ